MAQLTTTGVTFADPPGAREAVEGDVRTPGWLGGEVSTLTPRAAPGTGVHDAAPDVLHISLVARQPATFTQGQRQAVAITVRDPLDGVTRYTPPPTMKDVGAVSVRHRAATAGAEGVFYADAGAQAVRTARATFAADQELDLGSGATRSRTATAQVDKNTAVDATGRSVALLLPAATSNNFTTPDSAALSMTGDLDLRILVAPTVWNSGAVQALISKYSTAGHRSWNWTLTATNHMRFDVSTDGTNVFGNASSPVIPGVVDGQPMWLRTTYVQSTGSEAYQTSPDGVTWTTFSTRTTGTSLPIFDSDTAVSIGAQSGGSSYLHGQVYYAEIRNGVNGPVVAAFKPSLVQVLGTRNPSAFTGPQGNVWTGVGTGWDWALKGAARLRAGTAGTDLLSLVDAAGTSLRHHGDTAGMDTTTAVNIGGAGYRAHIDHAGVEQRQPPANDDLVNFVTLTGLNGAVSYSTVAATVETAEDLLDSRVVGPAGSVWYGWNQSDFTGQVAFAAESVSDRVEAYVSTSLTSPPDFPQGWFDDTTDYATWGDGYYQNAYLKLFRVVTTADIPAGSTWSPMVQASDQRTDGTGYDLVLDMFVGNPGDPSHEGYGAYTGIQDWDHNGTYTASTRRSADGLTDSTATIGTAIPAGTMIWLLAQQWSVGPWSDPLVDPTVNWDPKLDMGAWADSLAVPFTPWNLANLVQVELPVPADQWSLGDFSDLYAGLTPVGGGDGSVIAEVRPGETLAVRIYPLDGNQPSDGLELSWQAVARPIELTILQPVITTPGVLQVAVTNETAGETLSFTVDTDPTVLDTVVVDEDGAITAIIATDGLAEGDHLVYVVSDTGRDGSAAFTVANDTTYFPPDPTVPPVDPIPPIVVNKWQLYDPTDQTAWTFPINPAKHDSLVAPRMFSFDHTSSPLGQHLVFEAMPKPKQWKCSGTLLTLADVEALTAWRKPYLVYLTDDFGRNLRVRVLNVQTKPGRSVNFPELHTYTITCILYGRN